MKTSAKNPASATAPKNQPAILESGLSRMAKEKDILARIADASQERVTLGSDIWTLERALRTANMDSSTASSRLSSARREHPHDSHEGLAEESRELSEKVEQIETDLGQKKSRKEFLLSEVKRLREEELTPLRQGCSAEEVVTLRKNADQAESAVQVLRDALSGQEAKQAELQSVPTTDLETELEDLHAARALGRITEAEHSAKVEEVLEQISAAREANFRTTQEGAQVVSTIAGIRRQIDRAEADMQEIQDATTRAQQAFLEAEALDLVQAYMVAAETAKAAFIRLEGIEQVLSDQGVKQRLLPGQKHEFFLVKPFPAGGSDSKPAFFCARDDLPDLAREAFTDEVRRLRALGIQL